MFCKFQATFRLETKCLIQNLTQSEVKDRLQLSLPVLQTQVTVIRILTKENEPSFDHLPTELFSIFRNLETLSIDSEIAEISSDDLMNATNLHNFSLKSNKLKKLLASSFRRVKLEKLNLADNEIETIEDFTFRNQSKLTHLDLRRNKLTTIKENTFDGSLTALIYLDVSENEIQMIESDAFADLSRLSQLFLNFNKVKALEDHLFHGLTTLATLHIEHNQLESIGTSLYTLTSIEDLSLAMNNINDIDLLKLAQLPNLRILNMKSSGIKLGNIDVDFAQSLSSPLQFLHIGSNNFTNHTHLEVLRIFPELIVLNISDNNYNDSTEVNRIIRRISPRTMIME